MSTCHGRRPSHFGFAAAVSHHWLWCASRRTSKAFLWHSKAHVRTTVGVSCPDRMPEPTSTMAISHNTAVRHPASAIRCIKPLYALFQRGCRRYDSKSESEGAAFLTFPNNNGRAAHVLLAANASREASAATNSSHSMRLFFTSTINKKIVLKSPLNIWC